MATVDLTSLQETAIRRQKDLKMLPYAVLAQTLGLHGINLLPGVQNKDVLTDFQRKGGIMKPYDATVSITHADVGKANEMVLQVEKAYASVKDNIQNYKTVAVGPDVLLGKNKSKKHPWQLVMLESIVRTFGEDILDALFPAARDISVQTPQGAFNGYDTLIDAFIAAEKISVAVGNLKNTFDGVYTAFVSPANESDTEVADRLLKFWRDAHPQLRNANSLLYLPFNIADMYDDAFFHKFRYKPTTDEYGRPYLNGSGGKCRIVRSNIMGTGQRIMLTIPGNLDFGMDTISDSTFIQVRYPYEDPNFVQFWIQGDYGTRIRSIHPKVFQINEGTPVANALSGDYV